MAVAVKIISADGEVRTVEIEPGDPVVLEPGDTVVLESDSGSAVATSQSGDDLVIATDDGDVVLGDFFKPQEASTLSKALAFKGVDSFIFLPGDEPFVATSYSLPATEGSSLPENGALPESFNLYSEAARAAAVESLLTTSAQSSADSGANSAASGSGNPPQNIGDPIQQSAGTSGSATVSAADDSHTSVTQLNLFEDGVSADLAASLLQNDTNSDGTAIGISAVDTSATTGTVTFNAGSGALGDETITYAADANAQDVLDAGDQVNDLFNYTVTNADGSTSTATATLSITGINDAPNSNTGTSALAAADTSNAVAVPVATRISSLVANAGANDVDGDSSAANLGIAVTGATTTSGGTWQFSVTSTNGLNGTWQALGNVAGNAARVLSSNAWVRFVPPTDGSSGNTETLSYRAWDGSDGVANGSAGIDTTGANNGGETAYSTNAYSGTHAVNAVNDAPVVTGPTTFAVDENSAGGTVVGTFAASDSDVPTQNITYSIVGGSGQTQFNIDPTSGQITVSGAGALDREATANLTLQVRASDDGTPPQSTVQTVTINLNGVNEFTPNIDSGTSFSVAEESTAVTTVTAVDGDAPGDPLTFSIAGTGPDDGLFTITAGGQLSFSAPPSFETPGDVGGDNFYDIDVQVSDGANTDVQRITIEVTDINDPPVFTSTATPAVDENTTAVITVMTTDDENTPATYAITGGADAALFTIGNTDGVLAFNSAQDFEAPGDANADNIFEVEVTADDGEGETSVQLLNVSLSPVNESAPVFTSAGTFNVDENVTAVATVTASDADLPAETLTFSLSGGVDQGLFSITSGGVLTFQAGPDFEAPGDNGGDNVYNVDVDVSDGTNTTTQSIAVTVDPVNDANPVFTSSAAFNVDENTTAITTVTASDADLPAETLTFSLSGGADQGLFSITSGGVLTFQAGRDFEAPADNGGDNVYNVDVDVSDGTNTTTQSIAVTVDAVNDNNPVFTSGTTFNLFENNTAVTTVTASDADLPGDTLTFTMAGSGADDALFSITTGGALSFQAAPDFESPGDAGGDNVYNVDVNVSDGTNTTLQSIAVTVDDIGPTQITSGASFSIDENATAVTTVAAASEGTITYSIGTNGDDDGLFTIDGSSGALSFIAGPDFENPGDVGTNNVYEVEVLATTAASGNDNQIITVTVGPLNDNSPVFTSSATFNVDENTTAIATVTASDADVPADTLTFSLSGGADQGFFGITSGGVLTFQAGRDFEAPADTGGDNVYNVDVDVTDGTNTTTQSIAVTIDPVNDASPVFTSGTTFNVDENTTAITTVTATDADLPGETLTFSIAGSGADDGLFSITSGGVLTFQAGRDFENPSDVGGNNVYNVDVDVSDGTNTTTQSIAVTVDAVNDASPVFTSGATFNVDENATAVATVTASDADLPAETLTFSLSGGVDQGLFSITSGGVLTFQAAPDFEAPGDTGGDNVYNVDVDVSDGMNTTTQSIAVTVDPVNDANPVFTSSAAFNVDENTTAITTVTASDADLPAETLTFSLSGGVDQGLFSITSGGVLTFQAGRDFEAPADNGGDNVYNVDVDVSDGTNTTTQSIAVTVDAVNDNNPVFTSGTAFNLFENNTAVTTVTASDADLPGDTLTFTMAGSGADDALFSITTGGALSFQAAPDFESPGDAGGDNVYNVDVNVSDGTNTTLQSIAVTVDDIGPTQITSGASFSIDENATAVTTVAAASEGTITYSIGTNGDDDGLFTIDGSSGALSFIAGPDFENPGDVGTNNVYEVEVLATTAASGNDNQIITVTVGPLNDNNPVFTSSATFNVDENTTAIATVTASDADVPADTLTFSLSGGADQGFFSITSGGVLTFQAGRDFEAPADTGGDNVYNVDVDVSDGTNTTTQSIAVTIDPVNDASPVFTSGTTFNVDENTTAITTVTATDADLPGETLTFSIAGSGADDGLFSITSGGVLTFQAGRDFENPSDVGGNNVYNVDVDVSDGTNTTTQSIAVTVDPVNDASPVFTSATTFNVDENTTAITTVTASDADLPAETLTFSLSGGVDQGLFSITSGGVLTFQAGRDFEAPADTGADNVYNVDVDVSDGTNTTTQSIAVTVDPVNDASPVFTSGTTFSVDENTTAITTVTATDADLPAETLTFSLSGGADQGLFSITSGGVLTFQAGRDFEAPADNGGDNVYNVDVDVSDGTNTTTQSIAVTVDAVNDNNPVFTSGTAFNVTENNTAVTTVTASDADLPGDTLTFTMAGSGADDALFAITSGGVLSFQAAPDFENPGDNGGDNVYNVDVNVSDGTNTTLQSIAVTVDDIGPTQITSGASFSIDENATAVTTVAASSEGTITYSIGTNGDDDGLFTIDGSSGALSFIAGPDFENPGDVGTNNVYEVEVLATTAASGNDNQIITVTVGPLNDNNPVFTSSATFNVDENTTAIATVTASDADVPADTLTFSLSGGADQGFFSITSGGVLTFQAGRDFEAPADTGGDNVYNVDVDVSDGTNTTTQSIAVTIDPVNDASPVFTSGTTFNVDENTTAITTVTATDADLPGETLTFSVNGGTDAGFFSITSGGVLTFQSGRDFENALDTGGNNVYNVDVDVSDGTNTTTQSIAVTVDPVNDANPVFTSATTFNVDENTTAITTVTATDADLPAETLTFSLSGGADQGLFSITSGGVLTFQAGRDFENPGDVGTDNVYNVDVDVSDGTNTTTQSIAVTVDPVNDNNPVFTSGTAFSVDENTTAITTVSATDADLPSETLTFSLGGGVDAGFFSITSGGVLTFQAGRDFEAPADTGGDNVYNVDVDVSDGTNTTTQSIAVTVDAVNDNNPVFTSGTAFNVTENSTAVTTVTASDADLPGDTLTFTMAGSGADDALFAITSGGVLSFQAAPDFENPGDNGGDNVYNVDVNVSDGTNTTLQSIAVTVDDIGATAITSGTAFSIDENATAVTTVAASSEGAITYSIGTNGDDDGLFTIDGSSGALSFIAGPDFENPGDVGTNNVYEVEVLATTAGAGNDAAIITVTVDPLNDNSPVFTSSATFNVDENTTAIATVTASDADMPTDTLTFSLSGGADQGFFSITSGGVLTFQAGRDFEAPADTGGNNVYNVDVDVSDGTNTTTQSIAVTVDPVNDASPVFTSATAFSVDENTTAITTVTATDADLPGETLTFSVNGGTDAGFFSITSGGVLTFQSGRDFENALDTGGDNVYNVDVDVSDGTNTTTQSIAVTVDPVNDANPVFTSATTFNVDENTTAITTVTATDADLPAETLTFSLSGGVDQGLFSITSGGVLTFQAGRDFENPGDVGTDNVYNVDVDVSDGTNTTTQSIAVTVDPVNDANPVFTSGTTFNVDENTTAITTVTATDADLPSETLTFSLGGGADAGFFSITSGGVLTFQSGRDFENALDSGGNNVYNVDVDVSDGTNTTTQSIAVTVDAVNDNNPVFTSGTAFNVTENNTAVTTVTASDADLPGDTLTFTMAGSGADDALFAITSGGVLSFQAAPDFESPGDAGGDNVYNVDVNVSDGTNTTLQSIAVTVDDIGPTVITSGAAFNVDENAMAVTTVAATSEGTITYSIGTNGDDDGLFTIDGSSGALSFIAGPDFENPGDVGTNNVYEVEVLATTAASGSDAQIITITVDPLNDNSPVFTSSATFNVDENTTAIATVAASDADVPADTLTFSLSGGVDQGLFSITSGGVLTFQAGRDFEAPADTGGNNVYNVDVDVSDGTNTTTQSIAVTIDPVNDASPVFTSGTAFSVDENQTAITTVTATDADLPGETLTFSVNGGTDAGFFSITSGGVLTFQSGRDFENALDTGGDNVYNVDVDVSDGTNTTTQSIAVTVDPVNDANPVFTSATTFNVDENTTAITTVTATDADLPAETLTFSLGGGVDQGLFSITSGGVLTFQAGRDFENPGDVGTDNVYNVDVDVSDGTNTTTQSIAVTVDPVNDNNPVFTSGTAFNVDENTTAVTTVTATDADLPSETLTFSLGGGADAGFFSITSGGVLTFQAGRDFENALDSGGNNVYNVDVDVSDGTNTTTQSIAVTVDAVNDNNPVFTSGTAFSIDENSTAVTTVTATDADLPGDTLTFTIAGTGADDGDFSITSGGALSFQSAPDFDNPGDTGTNNIYNVDVRVSDGTSTVDQSIAVTVDPLNDNAPIITANALTLSEGDTVLLSASNINATDGDNPADTLTFSVSSVSGGAFQLVSNSSVVTSFTLAQITGSAIQFVHDAGEIPASFATVVSDSLNTSGAPATATITYTPVNDAPINAIPLSTVNGIVGDTLFITGQVSVADADEAAGPPFTQVTLDASDNNATITVDLNGTSGAIISDQGTDFVTLSGTIAQINGALEDMSYLNTFSGGQSIVMITNDNFTGDPQSDSDTINLNLTVPTSPPSIDFDDGPSVANQNVDEDTPLVFDFNPSASVGNGFQVSDPDSGTLTVTLSVVNGELTLNGISDLSGDTDGSDGMLNFSGLIADLNTALDGLQYLPTPTNFVGSDTLSIDVSDLGLMDSGSINITIDAVNDAPTVSGAIPGLSSIADNAGAPVDGVTVGTLINSLVVLDTNVTDPDSANLGMAITDLNTDIGTWHISLNGGNTWSLLGSTEANDPSATSAFLIAADANNMIYLNPNDVGTTTVTSDAVTFRVWDRSQFNDGDSGVDASAGGGSTPFSGDPEQTASQTVTNADSGGIDNVTLTSLDGTVGFKLNGIDGNGSAGFRDDAGYTITGIGDVNGDGFNDLLLGARRAEAEAGTGTNSGEAYIIYGDTRTGLTTNIANGSIGFDLSLLDGTNGVTVRSASFNAAMSESISGRGDFNGDGVGDILIGETNNGAGGSRGYVLYGAGSGNDFGGLHDLDISTLAGANDANSNGVDDGSEFGGLPSATGYVTAMGNGGDIDNDGIADILIGNAGLDVNGTDSGGAFLAFGGTDFDAISDLDFAGTNGPNVIHFEGEAGTFLGHSVSGIGDINNDGFGDFAIGATPTSGAKGKVHVVFGTNRTALNTLSSDIDASDIETVLNNGAKGFTLSNPIFTPALGRSVSAIGDFNGDGFDDFAVTAPLGNQAYVIFGKSGGFSDIDLTTLITSATGGFTIMGGGELGSEISGGGDINGDGLDDIVIGNRTASHAYILFGTDNVAALLSSTPFLDDLGLTDAKVIDLTDGSDFFGSVPPDPDGAGYQLLGPDGSLVGAGVRLEGASSSDAGISASLLGDVDGDGFDDVGVGAPAATNTTSTGSPAGQGYVVYGQDFSGTGVDGVSANASGNGDLLLGSMGDDTLGAMGFTGVVLRSGAGDDVLRVNGNELAVDAGGGTDILTPDALGINLDFDSRSNKSNYDDVEQIQLNGFGSNTLSIDVRDVLSMTDQGNELLITGDAGVDTVNSVGQGWSAGGTDTRSVAIDNSSSNVSLDFNIYTMAGSNATLLVQDDLNQSLIS